MDFSILNPPEGRNGLLERPPCDLLSPPKLYHEPVNSHNPRSFHNPVLSQMLGQNGHYTFATPREPNFLKKFYENHLKCASMLPLQIIMLVAIVIITASLVWTMAYRKSADYKLTSENFTMTSPTPKILAPGITHTISEFLPPPANILTLKREIVNEEILEVKGIQNIYKMDSYKNIKLTCLTNTIRKSMDEIYYKNAEYIAESINIAGPVSEEWIEFILSRSPNLSAFKINLDQVCRGAKVKKRDTLESLTVDNCTDLEVTNANICDIDEWFYRWTFPSCRDIIIKDTNLSQDNCIEVINFLKKMDALRSVVFQNSNVDDDCRVHLVSSMKTIAVNYTKRP